MTCIVAIAQDDEVYMGGDRGYSDSDVIVSSQSPKIFDKGNYLLGFAGNAGLGQNVAYTFDAPTHRPTTNTYKYIYNFFIPALRDHLKDILPEKDEAHTSFILGYQGKVFEIDTGDFQCVEYTELAIGSGSGYAYGSLHTTKQIPVVTPDMRIQWAIEAAIEYSPTCVGPIDILHNTYK